MKTRMFSTKMVANAYIRVYTIKPCKHVCFQRSTYVRCHVGGGQEAVMAAMVAMPAAMVQSFMTAMLNGGLFQTSTNVIKT